MDYVGTKKIEFGEMSVRGNVISRTVHQGNVRLGS